MKKLIFIIIAILAGLGVGAYFLFFAGDKNNIVVVSTQPVVLGSITNAVTATGTIEPIQQVEVGTQVSGEVVC